MNLNFLKKRRQKLLDRIDLLETEVITLRETRADLNDNLRDTRGELEKVKKQKTSEQEEIEHKLRMEMAKLDTKFERRCVDEDRKNATKVAKVKDEYRDKLEGQLEKRGDEIRSMYGEILERLPNVNMEITESRKRKTA